MQVSEQRTKWMFRTYEFMHSNCYCYIYNLYYNWCSLRLYRVPVFLFVFMPPLYIRFIVQDMETCMDQQVTDVLTGAWLFNIFANTISEKSDGVMIDDLMIFYSFLSFWYPVQLLFWCIKELLPQLELMTSIKIPYPSQSLERCTQVDGNPV